MVVSVCVFHDINSFDSQIISEVFRHRYPLSLVAMAVSSYDVILDKLLVFYAYRTTCANP